MELKQKVKSKGFRDSLQRVDKVFGIKFDAAEKSFRKKVWTERRKRMIEGIQKSIQKSKEIIGGTKSFLIRKRDNKIIDGSFLIIKKAPKLVAYGVLSTVTTNIDVWNSQGWGADATDASDRIILWTTGVGFTVGIGTFLLMWKGIDHLGFRNLILSFCSGYGTSVITMSLLAHLDNHNLRMLLTERLKKNFLGDHY